MKRLSLCWLEAAQRRGRPLKAARSRGHPVISHEAQPIRSRAQPVAIASANRARNKYGTRTIDTRQSEF